MGNLCTYINSCGTWCVLHGKAEFEFEKQWDIICQRSFDGKWCLSLFFVFFSPCIWSVTSSGAILWAQPLSPASPYNFFFKLQDDTKGIGDHPSIPTRKVHLYKIRTIVGKNYNNLEEPIFETGLWCTFSPSNRPHWHAQIGCAERLKTWVNSSGDTLFVIGKSCFDPNVKL